MRAQCLPAATLLQLYRYNARWQQIPAVRRRVFPAGGRPSDAENHGASIYEDSCLGQMRTEDRPPSKRRPYDRYHPHRRRSMGGQIVS